MRKNSKTAWEKFSNTGTIGAYLTYRAMLTQEEGFKKTDLHK